MGIACLRLSSPAAVRWVCPACRGYSAEYVRINEADPRAPPVQRDSEVDADSGFTNTALAAGHRNNVANSRQLLRAATRWRPGCSRIPLCKRHIDGLLQIGLIQSDIPPPKVLMTKSQSDFQRLKVPRRGEGL